MASVCISSRQASSSSFSVNGSPTWTVGRLASVASLNSGKRLGTLLVESGALVPEQLVEGVLQQVRSIVLDEIRSHADQVEVDAIGCAARIAKTGCAGQPLDFDQQGAGALHRHRNR